MELKDKTKEDLYDLANRVGAIDAIADAMVDRDNDEDSLHTTIFDGIRILIKPVYDFFYNDCNTRAVHETDEHEEPESPAKE
jgi:hypothetical protein